MLNIGMHFFLSFTLYLRLFIVMGVSWSMEIVSFLISAQSNVFLLTDICNTIQGVLIFVLFVLKRRVLRLIKKRFVYTSCYWSRIITTALLPRQVIFLIGNDIFGPCNLDGKFCLAKRLETGVSQRIAHQPIIVSQIYLCIRFHLQMIKRIDENPVQFDVSFELFG